jgi:hypothetical protein
MIKLKRLRKRWVKASIIVTVCIIVVTIVLIVTASHWWKLYYAQQVTCNGQPCNALLYRSRDGNFLVSLADRMYIIFPEHQEIGITSPSNFFNLPGYLYSKQAKPTFALMSPVKSVEPDLVIQQGYVEFNSTNMGRIRIVW